MKMYTKPHAAHRTETTLFRVVNHTQLLPDEAAFTAYADAMALYVNGKAESRKLYQLFPGDFIQLTVSPAYYIMSR
jgi:hypothetical protein